MPKERSNTPKKDKYWGKAEEDAIKKYLADKDSVESQLLFTKTIYPALRKLVEGIIFTYHLQVKEISVEEQIVDCMGFIVTKLDKFDPSQQTKAFSYFGTVAKHYLIWQKNKNYSRQLSSLEIEDNEGNEIDHDLSVEPELEFDTIDEYFRNLADEMEKLHSAKMDLSENSAALLQSICYCLRNQDKISIPSKNVFYWIAREMTFLSTKEITKAMREILPIYREAKENLS